MAVVFAPTYFTYHPVQGVSQTLLVQLCVVTGTSALKL